MATFDLRLPAGPCSHLVENVLFLCVLGWFAEQLLGRLSLFLIWLVTAVAGGLAELLFSRSVFIAYGASGIVHGLAGALSIALLFRGVKTSWGARIGMVVLAAFIIFRVAGEWYLMHRIDAAHAGGLLAGLMLGSLLPLKSARPET